MSAKTTVRVERNGEVTTVILSRPEVRNAVDDPTAAALVEAFREFERDEEASVAVLWGEGGTFCAGADLRAVARGDKKRGLDATVDGERFAADGPMGPTRMELSKPVIAAVAGHAVAGGLELALWCDLRVVEEDAVLGVFCRRWGVPLIDGGTLRLPRLVGLSRALDLILTGRPVTASEALSIGLANRLVPRGESRGEAERLARELARFPQLCLRADRASAYRSFDAGEAEALDRALRRELESGVRVLEAEARPGATRFASGRGRHGSYEDL